MSPPAHSPGRLASLHPGGAGGRASALLGLALAAALLLPAAAQAAPTRAQQALKLLRQGRSVEAAEVLRAAAVADPRSAPIATDLGFALARLGQAGEAEAWFRKAIALDPGRWYAYANLASLRAAAPLDPKARDELVVLLEAGLRAQERPGGTPDSRRAARVGLLLALADVERAAGSPDAARARLAALGQLPLTPAQERRAKALRAAVDAQAARLGPRADEPWPEPVPDETAARQLAEAERLLAVDPSSVAREAERLRVRLPGWRAPLWLRARALLALGKLDDAVRELDALVRLDSLHARGLRLLGETLAAHGGQFDADRADEALRRALSLEPAWSDLWLVRGRLLLRRGRGAEAAAALQRLRAELVARAEPDPRLAEVEALLQRARAEEAAGAVPPTRPVAAPGAEARALLQQGQERLARGEEEAGLELLRRALAESPALLDAAALLAARTGAVPEATERAIWDDAPSLLRLAEAVRAAVLQEALRAEGSEAARDGGAPDAGAPLDEPAAAALARPWINRAAALGSDEALLLRARQRGEAGDLAGARADLVAAVAQGGGARLEDARALRQKLEGPGAEDPGLLAARALLADGRPGEALSLLGGTCVGAGAPADPARLLLLGAALDHQGDLTGAIACARAAAARRPGDAASLQQLARAAARAPLPLLDPLAVELQAAARAGVRAARLPLARWLAGRGRGEEAAGELAAFLSGAEEDEPGVAIARALASGLERQRTASARAARTRGLLAASAAAAAALAGFLLFFRGLPIARALRRDPGLFPAAARAVFAVRHDVLKHRASALSMLDAAPRADVAHALLEPRPASALVHDEYAALREIARARGVALRRLPREPAFGPLFRDLRRAEETLRRPEGPRDGAVRAAAARLRAHGDALAGLLRHGPRTRLDAAGLSRWLAALAAEARARGMPWSSPALELQALELDFPVSEEALGSVLANLVRNAQAAVAGAPEPRVLVRVAEERDAAGRRLLVLGVADSSPRALSLDEIAARESGRGLALVRDHVREWRGHLRVRAEAPPLQKAVDACFPA